MEAKQWIETLGLKAHPEGGYYREMYRSEEEIPASALPAYFGTSRPAATSIYYLLEKKSVSNFHRLRQDEIWHFYDGSPMMIYTMMERRVTVFRLGRNPHKGQLPQILIPKDTIFAAEVEDKTRFSLVGCTVHPGFSFEDFELPSRADLLQQYPEHIDTIRRFSRP